MIMTIPWFISDSDKVNWSTATRRHAINKVADDGEFWMEFSDFCKHFNTVTSCTLNPDLDGDGDADYGKGAKGTGCGSS